MVMDHIRQVMPSLSDEAFRTITDANINGAQLARGLLPALLNQASRLKYEPTGAADTVVNKSSYRLYLDTIQKGAARLKSSAKTDVE